MNDTAPPEGREKRPAERTWRTGERLAPIAFPAISRHALALYCGGSGDHNPLHTDIDFARSAGQTDVIAHGMLSMAYLGRFLTAHFDPAAIRSFSVRFTAPTRPLDEVTCSGVIEAVSATTDGPRLDLTLEARTETALTVTGRAVVSGAHGLASGA